MIFRQLLNGDGKEVPWDGKLPDDSLPAPEYIGLYEHGFIPIPCKAGDSLAFAGELDHLSLPNNSSQARHTFQLHCVEGERAGVYWSKENWLQYPPDEPFMKLNA
jgi:phytanoyl-CoA hydroxylase